MSSAAQERLRLSGGTELAFVQRAMRPTPRCCCCTVTRVHRERSVM